MSNSKGISIFGFFDSIPFTVGAAVWFALLSKVFEPTGSFLVTLMFVNMTLSAGYAGRSVALFMRFLEAGRTAAAKTPEEVNG